MEDLRSSLVRYAYNILGAYEAAKDIVQDAFLKFTQVDQEKINDKRAYLIRMVVNLSIDEKRKQKRRRAEYPGPWLPEPIATDDPQKSLHSKQILSYSLMVLLEKLNSRQRAVFILKEAFDYEHDEIAPILGITVENSRKILSRAKHDLNAPATVTPVKNQTDMLHEYFAVLERGDVKALEALLSREVTVISDGGGKASAFRNVVRGSDSVRSLLMGLHKKSYRNLQMKTGWINHQCATFYYSDDKLVTCQIFSLNNQQFDHIFFIRNPEKLSGLKKVPEQRHV